MNADPLVANILNGVTYPPEREDEGPPEQWQPVDLAPFLDGTWSPPKPEVLYRSDGTGLFYRGNVNWIHGPSGSAKTFIMLRAVADEIIAGRHVVWIHYEDPDASKLTDRLLRYGVPREEILARFHAFLPRGEPATSGIGWVLDIAAHYDADLVIIDSVGEALNAEGIQEKEDAEVGRWLVKVARVVADGGRTFIGIDHSTLAEPGRLDASGTKRKRAAVTGAGYVSEVITPATKDRAGTYRLTCSKDRMGNYAMGDVVALVQLTPSPLTGSIDLRLVPPVTEEEREEAAALVCARAAVRALEEEGTALSKNTLLSLMNVKGRKTVKEAGIDLAVARGCITVEPGPNRSRLHRFQTWDGLR